MRRNALEVGSGIYQLTDGPKAILAHEIVPRVASSPELMERGAHFAVIGRLGVFGGRLSRLSSG
jgi:hypothetical protein